MDHSSQFIFAENQVSLNAAETLCSKHNFEREALSSGVKIHSYHAENGIYHSKEFIVDLEKHGQHISFSGGGAHHHNGVAERTIQTVMTMARTILLHTMTYWPEETSINLWPMAIDYAIYLLNFIPRTDSGLSPQEIFYITKSDHSELKSAHVWGFTIYVLQATLQDKKNIPRWVP